MSAGITLSDAITALVAEKRAVGYKYHAEQQVLARFEAFSRSEFPGLDTLTEASVQAWIVAARRRGVTPATLQGLIAPVRELARWLGRRGVAAYPLPRSTLPRPARYVPHIYTDRELAALFTQTDRCHYCPQVPLRHLVMPVLFRTIYACGLRCSEARLLRVSDVDIDAGVLQIRDAKGGKDRQVPVYEALRARLARYHAQTAGQPGRWEWFFPGSGGRALTLGNVGHNFRRFFVAGPHLPRRARARPQGARSAPLGGRRGYASCRRVSAGGGRAGSVFVRITWWSVLPGQRVEPADQ
ncbi:MAG: tyrosine-type recombinase/integrase, partial [Pseudonocardiaceae bacterium]